MMSTTQVKGLLLPVIVTMLTTRMVLRTACGHLIPHLLGGAWRPTTTTFVRSESWPVLLLVAANA